MAYGRLDIFFPDGTFRTFALSQPVVTIGRGLTNTLAFESDKISASHLRLQHQDSQTTLTDVASTQGTFIDGERIKAGESQPLYGGEEILIGDLRLIYHFYDDTPTRPVAVPEEVTQRIEAPTLSFAIDIAGPDQAVSPGAHISAQLTIHNMSKALERYTIEVTGLPREWIKLDPSSVEIPAGQMDDVIITFKPSRRPESAPGRYRALLTVRAKSKLDQALKAEVSVDILPFSGFGIALEDSRIDAGERFKLYLHNQGSSALTLNLSTRDLQNKLRFNLPNPTIQLAPGQRSVIQGTASGRSNMPFGEPKLYPFDLLVRSRDASGFLTAVRGQVLVKPSLPAWAPAAAIAGVAALALLVTLLAIALFLRPVDQPVIQSFSPSSSRLTQGETLTLNWDIDNAETLALLVNGTMVSSDIEPDRQSLEVDTSAYAGAVLLTIRATNASGAAEASQAVEIIAPLTVDYFDVSPAPLVRNVVQSITLNWRVIGATTTRISGLEGISQSPVSTTYGASGTVNIPIVPVVDLSISLIAQDAGGAELQDAVTIPVIDPMCAAGSSDVTLYNAPRTDAQAATVLRAGSMLPVDKRDALGQWLRFVLPEGGFAWAIRNQLICEETFNPDSLVIDATIPTQPPLVPTAVPPTTLQPAATPTAITPIPPTATGRLGG